MERYVLLEKIQNPAQLKKLSTRELTELAAEIRSQIISVVSENGGHLASSLGVVELSIALHYVFDTPTDRIIWDVGHQSYAHKLLTGRHGIFSTLRQCGGMSGFPKISESLYDSYNVGHSSTSLSLAAGEVCARDLKNQHYQVIPVIGDGSMTGGMAFEALNHIGHMKRDVIIVLNDNDHSISENVGALSEYFTDIITGRFYNKTRRQIYRFFRSIPFFGRAVERLAQTTKKYIKDIITPGKLFEDLGIRYFGPVDGHNLTHLIDIFNKLKVINNGPKIVHIRTVKGKGYVPAENNPEMYHGVSPFNIETGLPKSEKKESLSDVVGATLCALAKDDPLIIAITAAMTAGTGLDDFSKIYPDRFFDVGIAEQHAVTFAAALAKNGYKPFFAVYSTFLQRGYDQLIHDVAAMDLPVRFLIDRAGLVGEDGETHHGLFDISFTRSIPGLKIFTPADSSQLRSVIEYSAGNMITGPCAIRYPRGCAEDGDSDLSYDPFGIDLYEGGSDILLITAGIKRSYALQVASALRIKNISCTVLNLHSISPLPMQEINRIIALHNHYSVIEDHYLSGGLGEAILASLNPDLRQRNIRDFGYPAEFICHGTVEQIDQIYSLLPDQIAEQLYEGLNGTD
ncbi:MAG: 1-deoxy-D-xylulose-5-phosphate synthase [Spirochaetes bacterium]|jgi:1-deoxy-D-xylulose-5-phosphate synthase|nr:1-deoxy-D-xylulose-5-phosphate synthase [Spirochaetota bacterium]